MKRVKIIISSFLAIMIMITAFASIGVYAGVGTTKTMYLSKSFSDGWAYKNAYGHDVNAIMDASTQERMYGAYCLTGGLVSDDWNKWNGTTSYSRNYSNSYDLENTADINKIKTTYQNHVSVDKSVLGDYYAQILWILDNMYIPGVSTDSEKTKIFNAAKIGSGNVTENLLGEVREGISYISQSEYQLTDSDIEVVNQLALWYYTNYKAEFSYENGDIVVNSEDYNTIDPTTKSYFLQYYESKTEEYIALSDYKPTINGLESSAGAIRDEQAYKLFNYLITQAQTAVDNGYTTESTVTVTPSSGNISGEIKSGKTTFGPITINKTGSRNVEFDLTVTNGSGTKLDYTLKDENGKSVDLNNISGTTNVYIEVSSTNVSSANISLSWSYKQKTLWMVAGSNVEQPIVIVEPKTESIKLTSTPTEKYFDLALRKYITAVNGVEVSNTRVPNVNTASLSSGTTATYNHRKDPVEVKTGDVVTYSITIYNEGNKEGRATKIIDQLPTGLEFKDVVSGNFEVATNGYNKTTNTLTLTRVSSNKNNLSAYTSGTTLDSETIVIRCTVTAKASSDADTVLTNLAWIAEEYDAEDDITITNTKGQDRDSEPETITTKTAEDLVTSDNGYIGNDSNKSKTLSSSSSYFAGQQDDDDFEKVVLPQTKFDLALRKYITAVNGVEVSNTRVPNVNTASLSSGTTATYNHRKDPVEVKTGDVVTYSITIYNEGNKAGRATKIIDQLPTGLEFKQVVSGNFEVATNGYNKTTNKLTLTRVSSNTNNLSAYAGGTTLDSETIVIECTVTATATTDEDKVLTNLAWIAEEYNAEDDITITNTKGQDRDSEPETITTKTAEDLVTSDNGYIGNDSNKSKTLSSSSSYFAGQQDDDDFEKIKLPQLTPGKYNVVLVKEDSKGQDLKSQATFTVSTNGGTAVEKNVTGRLTIAENVSITTNNVSTADIYVIKETKAPDAYCEFDGTITLTVTKKLVDTTYQVDKYTYVVTDSDGKEIAREVLDKDGNTISSSKVDDIDVWVENGNLYVGVKNYQFDLKLVKFIEQVNSQNLSAEDIRTTNGKVVIDSSKLKAGTATTATYTLKKDAVSVEYGDLVTYTLKVYNEGELDGYASEISESIPAGLQFVTDSDVNKKYGWVMYDEEGNVTTDATKAVTLKTTYLSSANGEENLLKAFDKENDDGKGSGLSSNYVQVVLKVTEEAELNKNIRNEAAITKHQDKNGKDLDNDKVGVDRDSEPGNWNGKDGKPYQDDEDYDNVKLKIYDLSLRKFIIQVANKKYSKVVDEETVYTRAPEVDTSNLYKVDKDGKYIATTATYNHSKEPVYAQVGNSVIYVIRVYNEGQVDAYAGEITDHLPENLEFVVDSDINKKYGWVMYDEEGNVTTDVTKAVTVKTTYLSATNGEENLLKAFDSENDNEKGSGLSYKDVQIECKIKDTAEVGKYLTNIAEISEYESKNGNEVNPDYDSTSNNIDKNVDFSNKQEVEDYKNDEIGKKDYIPGQEDDDDFEKVLISEFDLALRKYITAVETNGVSKEVNSRNPVLKYENGKITYSPIKDPVLVTKGDVVVYTLAIYNEGTLDGYASEITDYILKNQGLVYLNGNAINEEYGWKMYDADGKETDDVSKAVTIKTDYLSKESGEARMKEDSTENPNLLKAFDSSEGITDTNPDRRYLKIAYKVADTTTSKDILVNIAEISDDSDEDGDDIDDIDSTPGSDKENYPDNGYNTEDHEDDIDYEPVIVTEFDLALKKFVSQAIVIENGQQTVTETGHTGDENPEPVVKVELNRKNLSNVTVKFNYTIKITNEGDIEGYAKEITDYIPEGLKFVADDNPNWTDEGNNVISTRALENTLLKPGESATVTVLLTWINGKDNLGLKTNTAEISEDYNEPGVPDRDSTPDNKVTGEDDIDDAPVILAVKTGSEPTYYILAFVMLVTVAGGILLIKKFVL